MPPTYHSRASGRFAHGVPHLPDRFCFGATLTDVALSLTQFRTRLAQIRPRMANMVRICDLSQQSWQGPARFGPTSDRSSTGVGIYVDPIWPHSGKLASDLNRNSRNSAEVCQHRARLGPTRSTSGPGLSSMRAACEWHVAGAG